MDDFARRIGQFLLFIGAVTLVIFWGTLEGNQPSYGLCLSGGAILALGLTLLFRYRPVPGESARFRLLKRSRKNKKPRQG